MVLRLISRSSRCPGLLDTVACASSRRLDAGLGASERHDFAVRTGAVRPRRRRVHRIPPRARDDARSPLWWDETSSISELIWVRRKQKYFCKRGLTRFLIIRSDLPVG